MHIHMSIVLSASPMQTKRVAKMHFAKATITPTDALCNWLLCSQLTPYEGIHASLTTTVHYPHLAHSLRLSGGCFTNPVSVHLFIPF